MAQGQDNRMMVVKLVLSLILLFSFFNTQEANALSVTTVAGNTYSGNTEGAPGVGRFSSPYGIVQDSQGNYYVVNAANTIAKVDSSGNITIVAGSGTAGSVDGIGTAAQFNSPRAIAIDSSDNIYIADTNNHKIRKFDTSTGEVTTIAGTGVSGYADGAGASAQFKSPQGIVIDSAGTIYVADTGNRRVRAIASDFTVSTYAGSGSNGFLDGVAASARFKVPIGLAINSSDDVFVADRDNRRIRKIHSLNGSLMVSTIAGSGASGDTDGAALSASFKKPIALSFDSTGNLFISDHGNHKIKRLDTLANVTTVAGTGSPGYADGDENNAYFDDPIGTLINSDGTIYVADKDNHSVRKIDLNAVYSRPAVSTIAGKNSASITNGAFGVNRLRKPRGAVYDAAGNLFIADSDNHKIRKVDTSGTMSTFVGGAKGFADGNGASALFNSPRDITIDSSGDFYVADYGNHRIRKITAAGVVTTFAGSGTGAFLDGVGTAAQFKNPHGITIDGSDNLYVADYNNHRIRKIETNQTVTTIAGNSSGRVDGPPASSRLNRPANLAFDSNGDIYIADYNNHAIRKLSESSGTWLLSTVAGGLGAGHKDGPAIDSLFSGPFGIAVDSSDNIYVADRNNQRIRKIDTAGEVSSIAGTGQFGFLDSSASKASFRNPEFLTFDPSGNLLVSDSDNYRMRVVNLSALSSGGSGDSGNSGPNLEVSTISGLLGVAGYREGSSSVSLFNRPYGMTIDTDGNIYVADRSNHRIRKIDQDGVTSLVAGAGGAGNTEGPSHSAKFSAPSDIVRDSAGNLYVADYNNHKIRKITSAGVVSTFAGDGSAGFADGPGASAKFRNPIGLAIDASDNIYVSDYNNHRIRKITTNGDVSTFAGTGSKGFTDGAVASARFNRPVGLAINASGEIYVADSSNQRIRKISSGTVSTVAGNNAGFSNGRGTNALFNAPWYLKFDKKGNLYVTDSNNNRIRKIAVNGQVTSFAGTGLPGFNDGALNKAAFNKPRGIVINSKNEIFISEDSSRIRKIAIKADGASAPARPNIPLPSVNLTPIIKLVSDIEFDGTNTFTIREGTKLKLRVFVFDVEDGFKVEESLIWASSLQGILNRSTTDYSTENLQVGTHHIIVKATDSQDLVSQTSFSIHVVGLDEDLGEEEGGGADRNGDGVIDENDREVVQQETNRTILHITKPKRLKLNRKRARLKAVALQLDDINNVENDLTKEIIWEKLTIDPTVQLDPGEIPDREFIGQGSRIRLRKLKEGVHTIYARVNDTETKVNVTVTKRKIIFDVIEASSFDEAQSIFWGL